MVTMSPFNNNDETSSALLSEGLATMQDLFNLQQERGRIAGQLEGMAALVELLNTDVSDAPLRGGNSSPIKMRGTQSATEAWALVEEVLDDLASSLTYSEKDWQRIQANLIANAEDGRSPLSVEQAEALTPQAAIRQMLTEVVDLVGALAATQCGEKIDRLMEQDALLQDEIVKCSGELFAVVARLSNEEGQ